MGLSDATSTREHLLYTPHLPGNISHLHLHLTSVTQLLGQHESRHGLAGNFFDFIDHVVLHCS